MTGEKPQCEKNGAGIQATWNNAGSGPEGAWEEPPGLSEAGLRLTLRRMKADLT